VFQVSLRSHIPFFWSSLPVSGECFPFSSATRAPIQIGIGIHSGPAIVGSIGSPQRLEFTAIGNTVNVASRVQGLTKRVGRPLLVTAAVHDQLRDWFTFEELPPQEVSGIEGRVMIFAVTA